MNEPYPLSLQTTYQDLLDAHLTRSVADIGGAPELRTRGGKGYWYVKFRIGTKVTHKYIGPDTPEVRERINQAKADREDARAFDKRCSIWVSQLRTAGLPIADQSTGKLLNAMAKSGVFRLGGTLVGTHAFRLYTAELGHWVTGRATAMTEDVDIAAFERLAMVIEDEADPSLPEALKLLGLEPVPGLRPGRDGARWRMKGGGTSLDFLTPSFDEREGMRTLKTLGVTAQSLHFLNYLIADPIPAVALYRSGVLVQIPRPERFAIHKLIVAQRRSGPNRAKARKDLAQARALIEALVEDRPGELARAYADAVANGPKWRAAVDASIGQDRELEALIRNVAG